MARPTEIRHVLLYGTLCASEPAHARLGLRASLRLVGRRDVCGTLFDLGPYPGLVLGTGAAPAELYRIEDGAVVARLDRYEGYDARSPGTSLFVRTIVRVPRHARSAAGRLPAWIYEFNGAVTGCPAIRCAWPVHRRRRDA